MNIALFEDVQLTFISFLQGIWSHNDHKKFNHLCLLSVDQDLDFWRRWMYFIVYLYGAFTHFQISDLVFLKTNNYDDNNYIAQLHRQSVIYKNMS